MRIWSRRLCLVLCVCLGAGFHFGLCDEKITVVASGPRLSWQSAADRCQKTGKKLCLRKEICRRVRQSRSNVYSPRRIGKLPFRDTWVPVSDEYNDWMYLGPKQFRQCKKLSESDGPPSWGGKNCSDFGAVKQHRKIALFCSAPKRFYCCENDKGLQKQAPYPVSVFITSRMEKGSAYYSFSLKKFHNESDWAADKASWRNGGRMLGDLAKFTLMSGFLQGEFEDPVFFCAAPFTTPNILYTRIHKISNKWCIYPYRTNFYLYGSYSKPKSGNFSKYSVGGRGAGRSAHSRVSVDDSTIFLNNFKIYGPDGDIEYAQIVKNACANEIQTLTSQSGIISSPNYPSKYGTNSNVACKWKIRAPFGNVLRIKFKTMKLAEERRVVFPTLKFRRFQGGRVSSYNFDKFCLVDKVEIPGYGTFCGSELPPQFFTIGNEVDVIFTGKKGSIGISFALYYESVAPPNDLTLTTIPKEKLSTFNWISANRTCSLQEKRLCKANEICSFDARPFYGVENGDQWVPISNDYNDWVQIGRGNVHTCSRHNQAHGPPQWGVLEGKCQGVNMSRPCPKREFLYCCGQEAPVDSAPNKLISVSIYSTVQNGVIFFKYLRENIDSPESFDSSDIWTPGRKQRGDFTSIKLYTKYSPGIDKVVYFCSKKVIPAIGTLTTAYAMFLQPCEMKGWKFLYHLYTMRKRQRGSFMQYVGIYEKRPHHSRVHFRTFPEGYKSDEGYILYSFGPNNDPSEEVVPGVKDTACSGGTASILAPSVLQSPGYPSSYENNVECRWHIRLPDANKKMGDRLKITIDELSLEDPVDILSVYEVASTIDVSKSIPDDNVNIFKNRKDYTGMVARVSLETLDSFLLVFKTDNSISDKGFKLRAEIVNSECGRDVTKSGDVITSPNHPLPYPRGTYCEWTIKAPSKDHTIELEFQNFDLVHDNECSDSVSITAKDSKEPVFCGGANPLEKIIIRQVVVNVTFKTTTKSSSSPIKGGKGFALRVYFRSSNKKKNDSMPQCGIQSVPFDTKADRIVRGFVAKKGNFPWVVMIGRPNVACGGSLLNDRWVLTASHCFVSQYLAELGIMLLHAELKDYIVIAGRHERNIPSPEEQIFDVSELAVHGGFQRYATRWKYNSGVSVLGVFPYNDISMAKLSRKAIFSPTVSPVCLPTQDAYVGDFCYVAGWGSKSAHGVKMVTPLNYAKVPILDNSLCNSWAELKGTIMENSLCAGYPQGGNDHCWGDSGGPLMCRGRYGNFYINGIVSWSRECGGRRTPGIYTRVWKYNDWIQDVIKNI